MPLLHIETGPDRPKIIAHLLEFGYNTYFFDPEINKLKIFEGKAPSSNLIFMSQRHLASAREMNLI
jgi:hypothetical protein